jgi:O-antigen ligase
MCIDDEKKAHFLAIVIAFSVVYLTCWANDQYLSGSQIGRIHGPPAITDLGAIYSDENAFAMLFVTGLPFLYYLGIYYKNKIIRYGLWMVIPLGWHAVFLTGSRGGLIGLAVTLLMVALRSPKKILGALVIPVFVVAYVYQAGDIMKGRMQTLGDYESEPSAESRTEAWDAALNMVASHPITGVGLASLGPAFPDFSDKKPREAHNTFLQISAESGLSAGVLYLLIVASCLYGLWKRDGVEKGSLIYLLKEATLVSIIGLEVCALFLSLQVYEIFYYLCLMANVLFYIESKSTRHVLRLAE